MPRNPELRSSVRIAKVSRVNSRMRCVILADQVRLAQVWEVAQEHGLHFEFTVLVSETSALVNRSSKIIGGCGICKGSKFSMRRCDRKVGISDLGTRFGPSWCRPERAFVIVRQRL